MIVRLKAYVRVEGIGGYNRKDFVAMREVRDSIMIKFYWAISWKGFNFFRRCKTSQGLLIIDGSLH